ncbi:MAG: AmmeMemoRadiSam system protein B [Planctomycetota bacterium]
MSAIPHDPNRPAFRQLDLHEVREQDQRGILLTDRLGISEPVFIPEALLPIVGLFDGQRTVAEIAREASASCGECVPPEFVSRIVAQLDERFALLSERFERRLEREVRAFLDRTVRPCRQAGSAGYPADASELRNALLPLFRRPGGAPGGRGDRRAPGALVAPHIDLTRGRDGYSAAYRALLAAGPADLYVIFGTGHSGPSAPLTGLAMDWETPLGIAATERSFLEEVHARIGAPSPFDVFLHRDEHSVEFQVLMLQFVHELLGAGPVRVAGFLCGALPSADGDPDREEYVAAIESALASAAREIGGRVCWVAGADLAHRGPSFGDPDPIDEPALRALEERDRRRISFLENGLPGQFHRAVEEVGNPDRVCSAPAIYLACSMAGAPMRLLHYGQAASAKQVVTFAALASRE